MKINNMTVSRVEYLFTIGGKYLKVVLSHREGKSQADLFLDGEKVYYHVLESFTEMSTDDVELIEKIITQLGQDTDRWIKDCNFIESNRGSLKLVNKATIYSIDFPYIVYTLKVTTAETGNGYLFKLEYTNNKNSDILNAVVEALDREELLAKAVAYAETIASISTMFITNPGMYAKTAFSQYFINEA